MSKDSKLEQLGGLSRLIRYYALKASARAGSGHPTSAMSATDLMCGLFFGGTFRYDLSRPDNPDNDRIIFSKGHASPLFYALWLAADQLTEEEMMTYREFGSSLEGHPTPRFRYCDVATGSLGQGLSIGVGMALNALSFDDLPYRTFVLLGDSEMAEGSVWEAIQIAAHYRLDNLIGVLDVNRLGQRGETMYGHDVAAYAARVGAFGWRTITIDGHDMSAVLDAFRQATESDGRPVMIIAHTIKGKGAPEVEDENGWHGKALEGEHLEKALAALGEVDRSLRGEIALPPRREVHRPEAGKPGPVRWEKGKKVATRNAFGEALNRIAPAFPDLISLDGEVSNSTRAEFFEEKHRDRFLEMYIAEQNMVGTALGLERRGKLPFVSSFAAFLTRAFDQIRMSQYSGANLKFVGSHAGVAIGQDGPSQMALEDLSMFRSLLDSVVLYPSDAVSADHLVEEAARHEGIVYIRTNRNETPVIYDNDDEFRIGGSKVLKSGPDDEVTVVGAGMTLHEALAAHAILEKDGIPVRVIDLYSVRPVDAETLRKAADDTGCIITVEDHGEAGGIADAVRESLGERPVPVRSLAVRRRPMSGKADELLDYEGIDRQAIAQAVREMVKGGAERQEARG